MTDRTELQKEIPKITNVQEDIIEFWKVRGYEAISHTLGYSISLHKPARYECLGLSVQYLEQFRDKCRQEMRDEKDKEIEELRKEIKELQTELKMWSIM